MIFYHKECMSKVSVIVPVYNVEKYLVRCMESLIKQTLEDIEIILVDDGSTDGSTEIMKNYEEKYPQLIKYLRKENGGLSDARNYGIRYAKGEYVAFLDSDDYVELTTYELMYKKAIETDSDMIECDFIWEYPNKSKIDIGYRYKNKNEMIEYGRVVAWNKLIKRKIIEKAGILYPVGLRYEDIEFFYKMIPYYNKVSFVEQPLIHYVQRNESISNSQNERTGEIFEVLDNVIEYYREENLYEEYRSELEYTYSRILLCSSLFRVAKITNKNVRNKLFNRTWIKLYEIFPEWKKNNILRSNKSKKNLYMRTVNKFTYRLYCFIFGILK